MCKYRGIVLVSAWSCYIYHLPTSHQFQFITAMFQGWSLVYLYVCVDFIYIYIHLYTKRPATELGQFHRSPVWFFTASVLGEPDGSTSTEFLFAMAVCSFEHAVRAKCRRWRTSIHTSYIVRFNQRTFMIYLPIYALVFFLWVVLSTSVLLGSSCKSCWVPRYSRVLLVSQVEYWMYRLINV